MSKRFYEARKELLSEWDDENSMAPETITAGSNRKVWWKDACGHRWEARVADRVAGSGCPYCAGRLLAGFNDLATTNPELISEWSDRNEKPPQSYLPRSREPVWWCCKDCGYEWRSVVSTRVNGGKCPACRHEESVRHYRSVIEKRTEMRREKKKRIFTMLKQELQKRKISFVENDTDTIGLPLPLYIPDYLLAVECSGTVRKMKCWRTTAKVKNMLCLKAKIRIVWVLAPDIEPFDNCRCINLSDDSEEAVYEAVQAMLGMIL